MLLKENPKIANMVVTVTLSSPLCKNTIQQYFPSTKYPKTFSGGILKYPDGCLLVFNSNKLNITGIQSITTATTLVNRFLLIYPQEIQYLSLKIVNITAYGKLNDDFDYIKLRKYLSHSYEPELFPGIHIKVDDSEVIFIVFHTGRIILTGVKDYQSITNYFNLFEKYYKNGGR